MTRTSRKLFGPTAFSDVDALFFVFVSEDVRKILLFLTEAPCSGFGYPLHDVDFDNPGNLFQFPTLMGFALQSISPFLRSIKPFGSIFPFLHFSSKPSLAFMPYFNGFLPKKDPYPFYATQRVSLGRSRLLSWAF